MSEKGLTNTIPVIEPTSNNVELSDKPLNTKQKKSKRVDINVLKSKLQETENRQFKKNLIILSSLIFLLAVLGVYLSL